MRPALLILLAAAAMTSAAASTSTPAALQLAPSAAMSTLGPHGETPGPASPAHAQTRATIQTVAMAAPAGHEQASPPRQSTDKDRASMGTFAPLAITLALIGAIALRRRLGGKA